MWWHILFICWINFNVSNNIVCACFWQKLVLQNAIKDLYKCLQHAMTISTFRFWFYLGSKISKHFLLFSFTSFSQKEWLNNCQHMCIRKRAHSSNHVFRLTTTPARASEHVWHASALVVGVSDTHSGTNCGTMPSNTSMKHMNYFIVHCWEMMLLREEQTLRMLASTEYFMSMLD